MSILLDTNILCRLAETNHPQFQLATDAVRKVRESGRELVVVPQVIYEYWVVATRPRSRNGLAMTAAEADAAITTWFKKLALWRDSASLFDHWRQLVVRYDVKGKPAHDTRLVAAMLDAGIPELLTFNRADFARYSQIQVFSPEEVLYGKSQSK